MKNSRLYLAFFALFGLSVLSVNAAQVASAKVLSVNGIVRLYAAGNAETPLTVGTILNQGDSISTSPLSSAMLVFSNGSELTIKENSSVTLAELSQEAFGGNKSYEQLKADPSKSQSLLQLNYGKVSGHVKKLRMGSAFKIETPLGTAAIRGTTFDVELRYNAERGEYMLVVVNKDGKVDLIALLASGVNYGSGNSADVAFDATAKQTTTAAIPPEHYVVVRLSKNDPSYNTIIDAVKNYPPFKNTISNKAPNIQLTPQGSLQVTPEDSSVTIPSINLPGQSGS